jgi:hypothetical protein
MPEALTDAAILGPLLPSRFGGVLELLQSFSDQDLLMRQGAAPPSLDQIESLRKTHDRLLTAASALIDPDALADFPADDMARLFARSVLLVTRLKSCIAAENDIIDTAGSRTLPGYRADFDGGPREVTLIRQRISSVLRLSPDNLAAIEAQIDQDLGDARRKQALVSALREEFGLRADAADLRERVHRLFHELFPDAGLPGDEIELVLTGTLIFFCLPHCGDELTTARYLALADDQRSPVRAFLTRAQRFSQQRFANFPAFGCLTADSIAPGLAERIGGRAGMSAEAVGRELGSMITILPLAEVDKYLAHDVWGHGWQATMLSFERMYEELADYADPLRLDESAPIDSGGRIKFGDCFQGQGDELTLDVNCFRRFVAAELAERLPVAMSAVLAELVADVAEFKFLALAPHRAAEMPSSSWLREHPALLDLTLQDLPFYFSQATKVFRLWARSDSRRQLAIDELVAGGASRSAAAAAVARAVAVWRELEAGPFAARLAWSPVEDGRWNVNLFTRLALNFVSIGGATNAAYRQLERLLPLDIPLAAFRDFLVIATAVFFEADRPRNLWRIDEFLLFRLTEFCQAFARSGEAPRS